MLATEFIALYALKLIMVDYKPDGDVRTVANEVK
jgi:hypothetical protein